MTLEEKSRLGSAMSLTVEGAITALVLLALAVLTCAKVQHQPGTVLPSFGDPIGNITVAKGRDITFTCTVKHLGVYKVGWVKADTKAIQAIHHQVVTHNPRVSVTYRDKTTWNLHIKDVQEDDRGVYMCQVNTDPMISMMATLEVVVPPEIVDNETSSDTDVEEYGSVRLECKARGFPVPTVAWLREGTRPIVLRDTGKTVNKSEGEELVLTRVLRDDMGPYLCIATNGIPPTVSKRVMLRVQFAPSLRVPIDMIGSPLGKDVVVNCTIESSPRAVNTWHKEPGEQMIISSHKYTVLEHHEDHYVTHMSLIIHNFSHQDANTYRCVSSNSLGATDSSVKVYEIPQQAQKNKKTEDDSRQENLIPSSTYENPAKTDMVPEVDVARTDTSFRDLQPPRPGEPPISRDDDVPLQEPNAREKPGIATFSIFGGSPRSSPGVTWWCSLVAVAFGPILQRILCS